jgi:HEAT repeat protein
MDILCDVRDAELRGELFALAGHAPDLAVDRVRRRGHDAVPALVAALREDSLGGVAYGRMLSLLVELDPPRALPIALEGLDDRRGQVRWAARAALGAIPGDTATAALIGVLSQSNTDDVIDAARILGAARTSAATGSLIELLASPDELVRATAEQSLREIDDPEARRALAARYDFSSSSLRSK